MRGTGGTLIWVGKVTETVATRLHTMPGGNDWTEWDAPGCFAKLVEMVKKN
jgi:hypothetical protein